MSYHTPYEIIAKGAESGKYRMSLEGWNILLRGGMAGAYIAMGASLMMIVSTGVVPALGTGIAQLLSGFVFPLGLILIVLTGAELCTGDAMLAPFAAFSGHSIWFPVLRLWALSYIGNIIGAIFFAALVTFGVLLQPGPEGMTAGASAVHMVAFASDRCSYPGLMGIWSCFIFPPSFPFICTTFIIPFQLMPSSGCNMAGLIQTGPEKSLIVENMKALCWTSKPH